MVSVLVPIGYVVFLFGSLFLFSRRYRASKGSDRQPWFPRHEERDIYVSLLSKLTQDDPAAPTPQHPLLTTALLRRAMVDVQRMNTLREAKQALTTLLAKGQIGDDLWNHLLDTEKELEAELVEVVGEANAFRPGWGQSIFPHASDAVAHEACKKVFDDIEADREKAREAFKLRESIETNGLIVPAPLVSLASSSAPAPPSADKPSTGLTVEDSATQASSRAPSPMPPGAAPLAAANDANVAPAPAATTNGQAARIESSDEDEASAPAPKPNGTAPNSASKKKKGKRKK